MPQEGVCQWKSILDESKARQKQSEDTQLCMHHKSKRMYKEEGTAVRTKTRATIEDLYKVEGKAELVNGEIIEMPPAGEKAGIAGGHISIVTSLICLCPAETQRGRALPDVSWDFGSICRIESQLDPDVAYHIGQRAGMRFAGRVRRSLPWKCGANTTMARRQSELWPRNAPTTSRAGRWLSGMWIY